MENIHRQTRQLLILLLSIFVGTIGIGILNPLVPQLFSGHLALFPNQGYGMYGLLVATYPFALFCSSFVLAGISDRTGRKRVLLLSLWGTALGYVLFVVAILLRNLPLLFVARAIDGFTGGNMGITQAAVADITSKRTRTSKISLIGGAFGLGLVVGPVLGGTLASSMSLIAPFIVAGAIAAINALLVWLMLPNLPAMSHSSALLFKELGDKFIDYMRSPKLRHILTASFLYSVAMTCFNTFLPVFLVERFHFNAEQIGLFYMYIGVIYAANQFLIVPWISGRWRHERVLLVGSLSLTVILLTYTVTFSLPLLILDVILFTIANGVDRTNFVGILSETANHDEQGKILGLNNSLFSLAQSIIPPLVGTVAVSFLSGLPFFLASIFMLGSAGFLLTIRHRTKQLVPAES